MACWNVREVPGEETPLPEEEEESVGAPSESEWAAGAERRRRRRCGRGQGRRVGARDGGRVVSAEGRTRCEGAAAVAERRGAMPMPMAVAAAMTRRREERIRQAD